MAVLTFTAKMYTVLFNISLRTAQDWLKADKLKAQSNTITIGHIRQFYALETSEILDEFEGKKAQQYA